MADERIPGEYSHCSDRNLCAIDWEVLKDSEGWKKRSGGDETSSGWLKKKKKQTEEKLNPSKISKFTVDNINFELSALQAEMNN